MYSQNNEEQIILNYFGDAKGCLLDIGANDGKTFSNSRALIERGWSAVLVEPSPTAYKKLCYEHHMNSNVWAYMCAVGTESGKVVLHESNEHCGAHGLVSTIVASEKTRWESTQTFEETEVECYSWADFQLHNGESKYDFISIDAEGMDYAILSQMDLKELQCKMICVETNSVDTEKYADYCRKFGMRELMRNAENLIMAL